MDACCRWGESGRVRSIGSRGRGELVRLAEYADDRRNGAS